jgi:hypothetical protein
MASVTTGALKLDFLAVEIGEVILRRIASEVILTTCKSGSSPRFAKRPELIFRA